MLGIMISTRTNRDTQKEFALEQVLYICIGVLNRILPRSQAKVAYLTVSKVGTLGNVR